MSKSTSVFIRLAMLFMYAAFLTFFLSGCQKDPATICRENITEDHLLHSLSTEFSSMSQQIARLENIEDLKGRACGPLKCSSVRDPFEPIEPDVASLYFKVYSFAVLGSPEKTEGSYSCRADFTIEFTNQVMVPHSVQWRLTLAKPHPVVGSMTHLTDEKSFVFYRSVTRAENALSNSAKRLSIWVKRGWDKEDPQQFGPHRFEAYLRSFEPELGVPVYSRLADALEISR